MRCLATEDPHWFRVIDDHVIDGPEFSVGRDWDEAGSLARACLSGIRGRERYTRLRKEGFSDRVVLRGDC